MKHALDPYRTLQIVPEAEPEVIQAAYRALARKHHPDAGASETRMAALNEAWALLRDAARRARHDRECAAAAVIEGARTEAAIVTPIRTRATTGSASGTVLDFGRYAGSSLGELAASDPDYLEWLARTPIGRRFQREIDGLVGSSRITTATPEPSRRRPLRRR